MNKIINRSWVEIDVEQFKKNISIIRNKLPENCEYLQLLKADAYGHGAVQLGRAAEELNVKYFGVANAREGAFLRENGIKGNIIILGPSLESEIDLIIEHNLIPSISDFDFAEKLSKKLNKKIEVHIEIDTGMGRGGIIHNEAELIIKKISHLKNLILTGIFSHFPNSDTINRYSKKQIVIFKTLLEQLKKDNIFFKHIHLANSGGFLNYEDSLFNMVRIGILSFGYFPGREDKKLGVKPILSFKSRISLIKIYKPGKYISYGSTFETKRNTLIGVIPVGYADGVFRLLSNKMSVLIKGQKFPIVGNISMDMLMVDITDSIDTIKKGDVVTLIGRDMGKSITADDWANVIGTINYEILTSVGKRAVRIYKIANKKVKEKSYWEKFFKFSFGTKDFNEFLQREYGLELSGDLLTKLKQNSLRQIFGEAYNYFRQDFIYKVCLIDFNNDFYKARIEISFKKWVNSSQMKIGVTNDENVLQHWMKDKNFIYRWFLKKKIISLEDFILKRILIENQSIDNYEKLKEKNYLIFSFKKMFKVRNLFQFHMEFETLYSKKYSIFPVYFSDFTKNARLYFEIADKNISYFSFFTGKNLNIAETKKRGKLTLIIDKNRYIFPQSGIIYYWR